MFKILYCIDSLSEPGGTERVTTTKLNWLAESGEAIPYVVTLRDKGKSFFPLSAKVRHIELAVEKANKSNYQRALSKVLTEVHPDATICASGIATTILPKIYDGSTKILEFHYTKNFLVNFVNGCHSLRLRRLHLWKMYYLQWKLARTAAKYDCFVGLTERDVKLWGSPKNMTYIYNPLSFRSEKKSTCTNHRIIAVGSFTPAKGMDQLIHAFGKIASHYEDWILDVYGSGQDKDYLGQLVQKYDIAHQVNFCEPCINIREKLLESSIYAFPSRSDGFGLVITEAMECGIPIVAMDCECGPREIITPECGILVPDKDIDSFSMALEKMMSDEALRIQMGAAAQQRATFLYPDVIMPQWIKLVKSMVRYEGSVI